MRKTIILLAGLAFLATPLWSQINRRSFSKGPQPADEEPQSYFSKPVQLIDVPTASMLWPGDLNASIRMYEEGGLLARLSVGISHKMMFGVSYGGDYIIGGKDVRWNETPGVHFAYRAIEENLVMPAIVIGIETQGYGKYWRRSDYADSLQPDLDPARYMLDRYSIKSRGLYIVASKGYESLWKAGLHAGVNYSLERSDKDADPNIFLGIDVQLTRDLSTVWEYDFALNDDRLKTANSAKGYLNAAMRWAFQPNMFIEFSVKNILADNYGNRDFMRILRIVYYARILER